MREIKFRAWNDSARCWVVNPRFNSCYNSVNIILEQYTGLKDKNGKEIYEGDIIYFPERIGKDKFKVVFYQGMFCFAWGNGTISQSFWPFMVGNPVEVIGNIHENPELLK